MTRVEAESTGQMLDQFLALARRDHRRPDWADHTAGHQPDRIAGLSHQIANNLVDYMAVEVACSFGKDLNLSWVWVPDMAVVAAQHWKTIDHMAELDKDDSLVLLRRYSAEAARLGFVR